MIRLIILWVCLVSFSVFAQQEERPPSIQPTISPVITVDAGPDQTIPGPSATAILQAIVGVTGGTTNGTVISWSYSEGPFTADFANQYGPTNVGTFTAQGRYTIVVRGQKGNLYNTNSLYIFVTQSGLTNFLPTVTITSPANGAQFTQPINLLLTATAQDKDGDVTQVVWYDGTTPLWTNTSAPYTFTLTNANATNYVFAAAVTDNRAATNLSQSVSVVVRPQEVTNTPTPPIVSILIPTNNVSFTAPVTFDFTASASDLDGSVVSVAFYDNDVLLATILTSDLGTDPDSGALAPYAVSVTLSVGSHILRATSVDNDGLVANETVLITVNNPPNALPSVTLTAPANGATFPSPSDVAATATATDSDGTITSVRFFLDGTLIGQDTTSPYEFTYTNLTTGSYAVHARAIDNIGAGTSSATNAITITAPPGVPPTVVLTAPTDGQSFIAGSIITLTATATDDGTVTNVAWFAVTPEQPAQPGAPIEINDDDAITYVGSWTDNNNAANRFNGDEHYSQNVSNTATFTFTGNRVSWYGTKFSNRGIADVYIDNVLISTVDEYSATVLYQQELFTSSALAFGSHTIKVQAKGTKQAASTGTFVDVDYFSYTINEPAVPASQSQIASDQADPFSQPWAPSANSYSLIAVATDNLGISTTSAPPVNISVTAPIPPVVQLTSPTNGQVFAQGSTINMTANASDQDGTVTNVVFMQFQPDVFLDQDSSSPYAGTWSSVPAGNYSLVAKAYDNEGRTTISTAVQITITATPPVTVVVDAGPFRNALLSPYKAEFDTEQTAQLATWNSLASSGTGPNYYNFQFVLDGYVSVFEGTKETNYLNQAIIWCKTMADKATIVDTAGKSNWGGIYNPNPYTPTAIAYELEETQGAAAMSRVIRVIYADPDLRNLFSTRALPIYNFLKNHIVNKWLVTRNSWPNYADWSQRTTSSTSDKPSILLRILLDLKFISGVLQNGDAVAFQWPSYVTVLAEGIKDYNGQEARFIPWQVPNALIWAHGKNWQGYTDLDTSHANRLPAVVVQGFEMGQTFTLAHINGLADLLTKVLWDQSTSSPQVRNFLDGSNGPFLNRPAYNNGKTYDGFYFLGGYNQAALNFGKYTALAVKNGVQNPTLSYQNSNLGRTAMAGHLARGVAMLETPPYAILSGTVSGSGTTGTNWTRVSGPGTATIVTPTRPVTTILFNNNAAGSHIFRLTITSAGPTVSDDVGVTVGAMPAFGSIGGTPITNPPPTLTTNAFAIRGVFYQTGNSGLNTTALYNRFTNIIRRAAAKGFNCIALNDPNIKALSPNATGLANLTAANNLANSLGIKILPYQFGFGEPQATSPGIELREAIRVTDSPYTRSGGTASITSGGPALVNGGFESFSGNQPTGWAPVDSPGSVTFIDTTVKRSGNASIRFENVSLNPNRGRASQDITVLPWQAYKLEAYVKTLNFKAPNSVKFYVTGNNNQRILWTNRDNGMGSADVSGTQDWLRYEAAFNSFENTSVKIYVMAAASVSAPSGQVWFDDVSLTRVGLRQMVRRASTPIVVTDSAGTTTYTEGASADYVVNNLTLTIPGTSTIPPGAALKVDWWMLADGAENNNIPNTACVQTFWDIMGTNFSLANSRLSPAGVMARFNEGRVLGHDQSCTFPTTGLYLSNVVMRTETLINGINPGAEKLIWADQWSPYQNALSPFYVMGLSSAHDAWKGVSTNWNVVVWQSTPGISASELSFWAGRNATFPIPQHNVIIGSFETSATMTYWLNVLDPLEAQGLRGIRGMMYVTWVTGSDGLPGNYAPLEAVADVCIARGRWPLNAFP